MTIFYPASLFSVRVPLANIIIIVPSTKTIIHSPLFASSPPIRIYFRLKEQPSVSLAFPPVGWHSTVEQPPQMTTVWACEKTVVMVKQPGHLTSMKKERGAGTRV